MERKILENSDIIYGLVEMPKGFEIDEQVMVADIFMSETYERPYPLSFPSDMLDTYIRDFTRVRHGRNLTSKKIYGNMYRPNEMSETKLEIDPFHIQESPAYVLLYGAKIATHSCFIKLFYINNEKKFSEYTIPMETNKFVMFPAKHRYCVSKNLSQKDNFMLTITYESQ